MIEYDSVSHEGTWEDMVSAWTIVAGGKAHSHRASRGQPRVQVMVAKTCRT